MKYKRFSQQSIQLYTAAQICGAPSDKMPKASPKTMLVIYGQCLRFRTRSLILRMPQGSVRSSHQESPIAGPQLSLNMFVSQYIHCQQTLQFLNSKSYSKCFQNYLCQSFAPKLKELHDVIQVILSYQSTRKRNICIS